MSMWICPARKPNYSDISFQEFQDAHSLDTNFAQTKRFQILLLFSESKWMPPQPGWADEIAYLPPPPSNVVDFYLPSFISFPSIFKELGE